jgi:ABC-2 type transport system ATP-binding protein
MSAHDSSVAVSVKNVYKNFKLPHEKGNSLKGRIVNVFKKKDKSYEVQHALRDISFNVKEGEFFGIVGRNGCGKSTLLKIIAEIYRPTKGSVKVHGKLVPFIELGVGFNPELTGRDNVYLNGALLGFSRKEIDEKYDDIVAFAELEDFMDQKLKNYSSGMQVRLAFSMATRAEADILLVDEVLAVGDADFQRKCYEYFKQLKVNKQTIIFVSHDMGAVQQYCDRAILIEDSRTVEIGDSSKISTMYSKMFIRDGKNKKIISNKLSPSGEERWGDGLALWDSVTVNALGRNENDEVKQYEIVARGVAKARLDYPIFGFSIKNNEYTQLIGTNTYRRKERIKPIEKGQKFEIRWVVPNIFNDGRHYIDCTIAHDQASQVSDRWPEAMEFVSSRVEDNPYPVYSDKLEFIYKEEKP